MKKEEFIFKSIEIMRGKREECLIRAKIRESFRNGEKVEKIAEDFKIHRATVYRIIQESNGTPKKRGRPPKLSMHDRRHLIEEFRKNKFTTATKIAESGRFAVSDRTIRRELLRNNFRHKRVQYRQLLTPQHCHNRLVFARSHISWSQQMWDRVIFTDKKRFNLVRNDVYRSIWIEGKKTYTHEIGRITRAGIMVWGAICCGGSLRLICIDERITSESYCHMLENDFFSETEDQLPDNFIWMHDNATPHAAASTKAYLEGRGINVMKWPALSPDLNPIENIWGIMHQKLYEKGKGYKNTNELWEAFVRTWHSLDAQVFRNLYNSMQRRMAQVLESNGKRIGY